MDTIKKILHLNISRIQYLIIILGSLIFLLLSAVSMGVVGTLLFSNSINTFVRIVFLNPLTLFILQVFFTCINIGRIRNILFSRPDKEIYVVSGLMILAGFLSSTLLFLIMIALFILPENFSESDFYTKNLEKPIERLSEKIASLFKND